MLKSKLGYQFIFININKLKKRERERDQFYDLQQTRKLLDMPWREREQYETKLKWRRGNPLPKLFNQKHDQVSLNVSIFIYNSKIQTSFCVSTLI